MTDSNSTHFAPDEKFIRRLRELSACHEQTILRFLLGMYTRPKQREILEQVYPVAVAERGQP